MKSYTQSCLYLKHSLPTPHTVWGLLPVKFSTVSDGTIRSFWAPFCRCSAFHCHCDFPSGIYVFVCIGCCQRRLQFWRQMSGKYCSCAMFWSLRVLCGLFLQFQTARSVLTLLSPSLPWCFPVGEPRFCLHFLLSVPAGILMADAWQNIARELQGRVWLRNVLVLFACHVEFFSCGFRRRVREFLGPVLSLLRPSLSRLFWAVSWRCLGGVSGVPWWCLGLAQPNQPWFFHPATISATYPYASTPFNPFLPETATALRHHLGITPMSPSGAVQLWCAEGPFHVALMLPYMQKTLPQLWRIIGGQTIHRRGLREWNFSTYDWYDLIILKPQNISKLSNHKPHMN